MLYQFDLWGTEAEYQGSDMCLLGHCLLIWWTCSKNPGQGLELWPLPATPTSHMGTSLCHSCYVSESAPCQWPEKRSGGCLKCLASWNPHERPTWNSWLLAWSWFHTGHYNHLESHPADGRPSSLPSPPPPPLKSLNKDTVVQVKSPLVVSAYHLDVPGVESCLHFWPSFMLMYTLGSSKWWVKCLCSCQPHGRSGWNSCLLISAWLSSSCCGYLGSRQADRKISLFFSFFPSHPLSSSSSLSLIPLPFIISLFFPAVHFKNLDPRLRWTS